MKASKIIPILLFLIPLITFFQTDDERLIYGRVTCDTASTVGINVINLVNEKSAVTNELGLFSILAKSGDMLVLASEKFEYKRKMLDADDMKKDLIVIKMTMKPTEKITPLDEVVIKRYGKIDDLNKRHKDHRDFTPAERRLYSAQSGPVDIVANWISGRTSLLKKELETEMNERLLARLAVQFEDAYYVETHKIPADHIKGFQYYLIEDPEFVAALKAKNKTLMRFHIGKLALQYNALINAK